jgi:CubicO group peptidase (beta-lactamase class C family)
MNYVVLGRVIEAVTGESWDKYIREHIFVPAGMAHSATHPADVDPRLLARAYGPKFGRLAELPVQIGDFLAPASNILSTAPDLARYAAAHLGTGAALLAPATLLEAHSSGVEMAPGQRYAYGWINESFDGVTVIHHGGAAGHAADIFLVPERQLAVAVLFGAYSHTANDRIAWGVVALALGKKPPPIDGPSELSVLMWIDRSVFGVTLACPATLAILPVARRRRRRRRPWGHRALIARAGLLASLAGALWFVTFHVLPENVPEFPLPFGFHGWTQDIALAAITVLLTSTVWALWGIATIFWRARSIAAIAATAAAKPG